MAEQEANSAKFARKKNRYRFNNQGNQTNKTNYKSKVIELENKVFDIGASSNPRPSKVQQVAEEY